MFELPAAALKVSVLSEMVFHVVQVANVVPLVEIATSPLGRLQFVVSVLETEKPYSPEVDEPFTDPSPTFEILSLLVRRAPSEMTALV